MPGWSGAAGVSVTSLLSGLGEILIGAVGALQSARVQTICRLEASRGETGFEKASVMNAPARPKLPSSAAGGGAGSVAGVRLGKTLSSEVWIWSTRATFPAWSLTQRLIVRGPSAPGASVKGRGNGNWAAVPNAASAGGLTASSLRAYRTGP